MENYFILLELPFDLPESDTNKISEAISKKQTSCKSVWRIGSNRNFVKVC